MTEQYGDTVVIADAQEGIGCKHIALVLRAQGKAAGATGWLNKPFDADMLISVARKLVG